MTFKYWLKKLFCRHKYVWDYKLDDVEMKDNEKEYTVTHFKYCIKCCKVKDHFRILATIRFKDKIEPSKSDKKCKTKK